MKNPYPYPIQITLFMTIMPTGGGGHYFVPGCGDCTIDYTIPDLTIDSIDGREFISPNCFVAEYENSIRNATWRTETFTLAPNTEQTYCQCAGGRAFEILAYYHTRTRERGKKRKRRG